MNNKLITDVLNNNNESIALFVIDGKHYYCISDPFNYRIDIKPLYKKYINDGYMSKDMYLNSINKFRNGFPELTAENFLECCQKNDIKILSLNEIKELFTLNVSLKEMRYLYGFIEYHYLFENTIIPSLWEDLSSRLPKFYVNFDQKTFKYVEQSNDYIHYASENWIIERNIDFVFKIPDSEQYWIIDNMNFWKLHFYKFYQ